MPLGTRAIDDPNNNKTHSGSSDHVNDNTRSGSDLDDQIELDDTAITSLASSWILYTLTSSQYQSGSDALENACSHCVPFNTSYWKSKLAFSVSSALQGIFDLQAIRTIHYSWEIQVHFLVAAYVKSNMGVSVMLCNKVHQLLSCQALAKQYLGMLCATFSFCFSLFKIKTGVLLLDVILHEPTNVSIPSSMLLTALRMIELLLFRNASISHDLTFSPVHKVIFLLFENLVTVPQV